MLYNRDNLLNEYVSNVSDTNLNLTNEKCFNLKIKYLSINFNLNLHFAG